MRELTVRIRFIEPSLGNVRQPGSTNFVMPRDTRGVVIFMPTWHAANMKFAAKLLNLHQDEVGKILWDMAVDGVVRRGAWHRRYYQAGARRRYALHEAFQAGQVIGLNCVVPAAVAEDDLWRLMDMAGRYKGLSPSHPGEFGFFVVESIRPRRGPAEDREGLKRQEPGVLVTPPAPPLR